MPDPICWAVVPAGGSGSRFSDTQDKLLVPIAGKPVLVRTISALLACPVLQGIVVVASEPNLPIYQALLTEAFPDANLRFMLGGSSRRTSVYQGLLTLPDTVERVIVHDAARPLIQPDTLRQAIDAIEDGTVGSIVALPVVDTVKQARPGTLEISQTVERETLWRAQTPQVFRFDALLQAHRQIPAHIEATDDAQLIEMAALGPVRIVPGPERNLKITSPADIPLAESFLTRFAQTNDTSSLL